MAHTNISVVLAKLDSAPITKANTLAVGGVVYNAIAICTIAATTVGQTSALVRLPARARIVSASLALTASMGNGDVKLGLYRPNTATLTAIDDACLAAHCALTPTAFGTSVVTAPTPAQMAQSMASAFSTAVGTAAATNDVEYDIVATVVSVSTGAATAMAFEVKYVLP